MSLSKPVRPPPVTGCASSLASTGRRLATAAAFAVLLVAGVVVSTWQAVRATSAERVAKRAEGVAKRAELEANQQRLAAEVAKRQALDAKTEADSQRDEARLAAYASGIGLAQRAWEENNVVRARELLAEVPKEAAGRNLRGFEWFYLSRLCRGDERNLLGDPGRVDSLAFSPDGQRLASGSRDQTLKIWDCATGKELLALRAMPVGATAWCSVRTASAWRRRSMTIRSRSGTARPARSSSP